MKVFLVYWHPEPQSFNHAMFETAQSAWQNIGSEVRTSDLYQMNWDAPSSRKNFTSVKDPDYLKLQTEELHATEADTFAHSVETQIANMEWCDIMIWQFPLWWFGLPAVFKGWVDRCFPLGRVYSHSKSFENGVFRGKRALLSFTTGGSSKAYESGGFMGDALQIIKPIHRGILEFTGFSVLQPHIVHAPVRMSNNERKEQLSRYAVRLRDLAQEAPIVVGGY